MNLAVADVRVLTRALKAFYVENRTDLLDSYSETALKRIWRAEHFSYWMTSMMHRIEGASPFEQQLQVAELEYVTTSRAAATVMAENYVGSPPFRANGGGRRRLNVSGAECVRRNARSARFSLSCAKQQ